MILILGPGRIIGIYLASKHKMLIFKVMVMLSSCYTVGSLKTWINIHAYITHTFVYNTMYNLINIPV